MSQETITGWLDIASLTPKSIEDYILWNGQRIVGWHCSDGWRYSDGDEDLIDPQPTLWHPWPEPLAYQIAKSPATLLGGWRGFWKRKKPG